MKVKTYVYVIKGGQTVLLRPGDTVPDGVTVTNPDVIEADAKILPAPEQEKAPEDANAEATKAPEPAPAPRKRTARKAEPASE